MVDAGNTMYYVSFTAATTSTSDDYLYNPYGAWLDTMHSIDRAELKLRQRQAEALNRKYDPLIMFSEIKIYPRGLRGRLIQVRFPPGGSKK